MNSGDTSLGGPGGAFPATTLGLLSRLGGGGTRDFRAALELLAARYWRPVYLFLRTARAKSNDDAKDLTQAFFLWVMEGDALRRYEPTRGGFRTYLKVLLRGFAANQQEAMAALKRGGGARVIAMDDADEPLEAVIADPGAADPEGLFDRAWLATIVKLAVDRVHERFLADGRGKQFRAFEAHDKALPGAQPSYAETAEALGVKPGDIRNYLFAVREAIRAEVRGELARLTSDDREVDEEWKALFGS